MAITKEQAIDILDMMDFFQGQRAGRELWVEKPAEVQEQDISNFSRDVHLLKEYITSDVIPRVEMDDLIYKLECLLCHATGSRLSKHTYDLRTMETAVTDYIQDAHDEGYDEGYAEATKEVAGKIFEKIYETMNSVYASVQHSCVGMHGDNPETMRLLGKLEGVRRLGDEIAELKKKYQIESTEL